MDLTIRVKGLLFGVAVALCINACSILESSAQDGDFFRPTIEIPATKTPVGGQDVYSFSRLDPDFTALCIDLEQERRRDRIVKIAETAMEREKDCITCRSFWKMIVGACGRLGPKPTRTPKPSKAVSQLSKKGGAENEVVAKDVGQSSSSAEGASASSAGDASDAARLVTRTTLNDRYPSVAMLDHVSRLSISLYESDPGEGATAQMLHHLAKTVREAPDLSAPEREYYDILFTYLLAAWDGRVDSTTLPPPTPSSAIREMFSFE